MHQAMVIRLNSNTIHESLDSLLLVLGLIRPQVTNPLEDRHALVIVIGHVHEPTGEVDHLLPLALLLVDGDRRLDAGA